VSDKKKEGRKVEGERKGEKTHFFFSFPTGTDCIDTPEKAVTERIQLIKGDTIVAGSDGIYILLIDLSFFNSFFFPLKNRSI
jgi:hypothetical protein